MENSPEQYPLAKIPNWLMVQLTKDDAPKQTSGKKVEGEIPDGKRNATLTSLAGSMRRPGMSQEAIEAALLVENGRCVPPLPEKTVLTIARSIGRKEPSEDGDKEKQTQQDILLTIASAIELFHTPGEDGYGIIPINGHRETWPIRSKGFRRWLCHEFYKSQKKGPQPEAVSSALQVLEAKAQFDGQERPVWVRIAEHEGSIYLDLGNASWEAVKITKDGWEVVTDPPVCFRRTRSMMSLPYPVKGGSVNELRPFINVATYADFILIVAFLVGALRDRGPYPVGVFNGEQGSAKTTLARVIAFLIDPSTSPSRSAPREVRDLMIAAINSWVLGFDNLSGVTAWLSDAMCRISTGGGFSTRELYTDREEIIFEATRPIILNGIDTLAHRHDLADRSLIFNLPQIPDDNRRPESQFWAAFEAARPRVLGALLDAVSMALRNIDNVKLPSLPRMADFAMWVSAAEPALPWPSGSFLEAYMGNRAEAVELSLEADCVAVAVREHMADQTEWSGKPSELYEELEKIVPENTKRSQSWPKAAHKLSGRLKRAATNLRMVGIHIEEDRSARKRTVTITRKDMQSSVISVISVIDKGIQEVENDASKISSVTPGNEAPPNYATAPTNDASKKSSVTYNKLKPLTNDSSDGNDARLPTFEGDVEDATL
jgi:hypothetical protein